MRDKEKYGEHVKRVSQTIERRKSELTWNYEEIYKRVVSGIVLAGIALFFTIKGGIFFVFFVVIFVALASIEIYRLLELKGENPYTLVGTGISVSIPFISYFAPSEMLFALLTFSLIAIFFVQIISREFKGTIEKVMMTYFGIVYVGWLGGAHAVLLRNIGSEVKSPNFSKIDPGLFFFLFAVATTAFADIGAYFFGKRFGKTKIAEKISPGKTVEGFLGGALFSIIVSLILKFSFGASGNVLMWILLGFVSAFFGLLGDFAESALKRDVHLKDSSSLIPGHGGVLDRIDSLLFTIPLYYYISKYILYTM